MFSELFLIQSKFDNYSKKLEQSVKKLTNSYQDTLVDENEFVGFYVKSEEAIDHESFKIILGEYEFDLQAITQDHSIFLYSVSFDNIYPEESNFWHKITSPFTINLAKIFLNNIGVLKITVWDTNSDIQINLGSIEITSEKIDEFDVNDLFDYLMKKEISYWNPFSLTSQTSHDLYLRKSFFLLIAQIEQDIASILLILNEFEFNPLTVIRSEYSIKNFDEKYIMDDFSIQWLFTNLDKLNRTKFSRENTVKIANTLYKVDGIAVKDFKSETDIYENQIIGGFFIDLRENLEIHLHNLELKLQFLTDESNELGKLSLIRVQEKKFFERQIKIINDLNYKINNIQYTLNETIPVKFPLLESIKPENRFEAKDHYAFISHVINKWYELKDLSWGTNELFGGIRTLDKLYELFCLYKLIDSIKNLGFNDPLLSLDSYLNGLEETNHVGTYDFGKSVYNQMHLKLFYDKLPSELCTIINTYQGRELRPDFVIELTTNNKRQYLILDAKFKKVRNIKKFTFSELIPKYLHGIGCVDGSPLNILGLIILYPEDKDNTHKWKIDFHKKEYDIYGSKFTQPIITAVELPFNHNKNSNITRILRKIISGV